MRLVHVVKSPDFYKLQACEKHGWVLDADNGTYGWKNGTDTAVFDGWLNEQRRSVKGCRSACPHRPRTG